MTVEEEELLWPLVAAAAVGLLGGGGGGCGGVAVVGSGVSSRESVTVETMVRTSASETVESREVV